MWFHSKGNILISQIQYLRQYLPILGVNRWSVNSMSIHRVRNSCYWCGWWDWQQKATDAAWHKEPRLDACIFLCSERICRFWKPPSKSKWLVQNTVAKHPRAWAVILTAKIFPRQQYQTIYVFCLKPRIPVALDLLIWVLLTETNICSQQKGLRVLNCHGCINAAQREHMQRLKSESESKRQEKKEKANNRKNTDGRPWHRC